MKVTLALLLAVIAYASAQRQCTPTELVYVFDHSEKSSTAFSTDGTRDFRILQEAWRSLMADMLDQYRGVDIRFWVIGYSSEKKVLINRGSSAALASSQTNAIGQMESGGSWTYLGLEALGDQRPTRGMNNLVIIVSAGGSSDPRKQAQSATAYNRIANNGWVTRVIGVQLPGNQLATADLNSVTQTNVEVITSGNDIKNALYELTERAIVCQTATVPPVVLTFPPVRPTIPPTTGICSSCKRNDADSHFYDVHPLCDGYYQCLPDKSYVAMACGEGLWWDNTRLVCDYPRNVACATGICQTGMNRRYASHLCCNKYFQCNNGVVSYEKCPSGQLFDAPSASCRTVGNIAASCNTRYCNERISTGLNTCEGFSPDLTGNPCKYYHNGVLMNTAEGTRWYQPNCTQIRTNDGSTCMNDLFERALDVASTCTPLVISTFDAGSKAVFSQRVNDMDLYMMQLNVNALNNALVFNSQNPVAYYYFFANNEIQSNSAFRMVFQLARNVQSGVPYDLFSNNFCVYCPETIGATVTQNGVGSYDITVRIMDSISNSTVTTRVNVNANRQDAWLDLRVIWGANDIYGQVNILDSAKNFQRSVTLPRVSHRSSANIRPNKCGLLLGAGANQVFRGQVDEFAFYTRCSNIDDVLGQGTLA